MLIVSSRPVRRLYGPTDLDADGFDYKRDLGNPGDLGNPDSRVRLLPTVFEDLCGLGRMRLRDLPALREQRARPVALAGNAS